MPLELNNFVFICEDCKSSLLPKNCTIQVTFHNMTFVASHVVIT